MAYWLILDVLTTRLGSGSNLEYQRTIKHQDAICAVGIRGNHWA
ncbi:TPA: hypothetical protein ACJ75O_001463 [Yersinia enterocolitica]